MQQLPGEAHASSATQVAESLGVSVENGLSVEDVARRREQYGPNG
jgi:hypothetical protein